MSTRDRALQAAVDLVGTRGVRALTHARVDAAAGLPPGSTSNHFRTRAALVSGVVAWIAASERADFSAVDALPDTAAELVAMLSGMVEVQTVAHAVRTRARYAMFLESTGDPSVQDALHAQRAGYEQWMTAIATGLGMPQPVDAARAIMACAEGLVLHRLTVDPQAPASPALIRVVRGCLG